jgi:hypothetical protein
MKSLLTFICIALSTLLLPLTASKAQSTLPASARPMTASELLLIYDGKSWKWENGAGFMRAKGRQLVAWSGNGGKFTYAQGRWSVANDGSLCFNAIWHGKQGVQKGAVPKRTCFKHMVDNGTIYQRKNTDGSWYIFKHRKPVLGDEFNKVVAKDLASARIATILRH